MTKQQLEARNLELVRQCNKETERADAATKALHNLQCAMSGEAWLAIPDDIKAQVLKVIS